MDLKDLKKGYGKYVVKYKLPSFAELDGVFEIHKIDRESDTLLRDVRKHAMEKVVNSLGFVEMLLSGMNAPRMYYTYLKMMSVEDRKNLEKIYSKFAELIISSLELEVRYEEKVEANLIKEIFKVWSGVQSDFSLVLKNVRKPAVNNAKKERSYFG